MPQRRLRDRFLACTSAGLLAAGLVVGSAGSASAATTVTITAPTVAVSNVWIQGAVSGSSSGATVRILKNTGGTWTVVGSPATVNGSRKYIVKVPLTAGANTLLAKASKPGLATGYSKSVKVYGVTHRGMILYQTNVQRKKYGLPALKGLNTLNKVAQDWTQHMYDFNDFRHNPHYWSQYAGSPKAGAENIASGTGNAMTSSNVVAQWMNSKTGHRETILDRRYNHIGIGYVSVGGKAYATQNFAQY